ncbi:ESX-1 secretion-associated protein [Gordonia iterans]|uniref:ESX-1 secretion-associated protein n=1 Tax=Gordonia iterans TaxID=1004901 RepID=A0A2S0KEC9_9ACTN|nr:ESX-1 secretion-associated protein [Gordonia iterans]
MTMKPLTVNDTSLSAIVGRQSAAAGIVAERALAERFDAAAYAPAFGLIGAPFLSALAAAMSARAARLDSLSAAHTGQAAATTVAGLAYRGTDAAGATEMTA